MMAKMDFVQTVAIKRKGKATIKFAENLELAYCRDQFEHEKYNITDVKGDFMITQISINFSDGSKWDNTYDKVKNEFRSSSISGSATFYITANVVMKEMNLVTYELQIPSTAFLKLHHFLKKEFVLPGFDGMKFTYYVKKIRESGNEENDVEIHIENPYDVEIQGKKGDFKTEKCSTDNINLTLSFGFYPEISDKSTIVVDENVFDGVVQNDAEITVIPSNKYLESPQTFAIDESRPESVVPMIESSSNEITLLQKLYSNNLYSDFYFITSEGEKIPSHRCILAQISHSFVQIFDEASEIPVEINVEDFSADTIKSVLNFFHDNSHAINGKETEVFKFAVKFGIQNLIDACCSFFEESVSLLNVCEYIQIAYLHNFDALKQKCLKLLVEKKKEIDPAKVNGLPKNILFDAFFF